MPVRRECSFCGHDIPPGTGMAQVRRDGRMLWFCSRKCRVSLIEHRRDPRKFKWTKAYQRR
jgi:large subunit ribosomal protein L24e